MNSDAIEMNLSEILGSELEPSTQQLTLYIPNKDKNGKLIENYHEWVKEARKVLTFLGRGSTAMPPADGTWIASNLKDVESIERINDYEILWEKTSIIYTYIDADLFVKNVGILKDFLHKFGEETDQGEVVFEFDGRFYRISKYQNKE